MQATTMNAAKTATQAVVTDKMKINQIAFDQFNESAHAFFRQKGWVVVREQLPRAQIAAVKQAWQDLTKNLADDIGVTVPRYLEVISQWRDLWKSDSRFKQLLHAVSPLAAAALELSGVRLFHDQAICKSASGANGEVPWHQDSMYWPVDRTGVSTWLAVQDTPVEHGCLEVADGSHLWGMAKPVDFMQDQACLPNRDGDASISMLPAKAGDIVLLHSGTWHRSAPTRKLDGTRFAHIALWVPQNTAYWPDNADWHPTNAQVTVAKGEVLNDDEFPIFGASAGGLGNSQENKKPVTTRTGGMFSRPSQIEKQVQDMLGSQASLFDLLGDTNNRDLIVDKLAAQTPFARNHIERAIERLWINIASFQKHRSRNVFCAAYIEWNELYAARTHAN